VNVVHPATVKLSILKKGARFSKFDIAEISVAFP